jgi:ribonuclease HII
MKAKEKRGGVIGIDEVGRGPLAGPITVCACYILDEKAVLKDIFQNTIRDSKKLTKRSRDNIYQTIRHKRYLKTRIKYAVFSRSAAYIDKHGISKATSACVLSCVRSLVKQGIDIAMTPIYLDAGLKVPLASVQQESFVRGDERFPSIALASIIAKVTRDSYMERLSGVHPQYDWINNVGYGTRKHRESILEIGVTKFHRRTYLKGFKLFDKAE